MIYHLEQKTYPIVSIWIIEIANKSNDNGEPPEFVKWLIWLLDKENWQRQPLVATVATVIVVSVAVTAFYNIYQQITSSRTPRNNNSRHRDFTLPDRVIVLMDSTLPDLVFDPDTRSKRGTNADDINEIIDDLPNCKIFKETTSLAWNRDQQVFQNDPDLIVIHLSAFYEKTNPEDSDNRLKRFLYFMADSRASFLFYTRSFTLSNSAARTNWVNNIESQIPALKGRMRLIFIQGGVSATFRNPDTALHLKIAVKQIL